MNYLWLILLLAAIQDIEQTESRVDNYPSCGWRFKRDEPKKRSSVLYDLKNEKRIVGGNESAQGSWPWQVALLQNGTQVCGGTLINKNWIVSASHCFYEPPTPINPNEWTAAVGEHNLGTNEVFEQIKQVELIIVHPNYIANQLSDVALLKLKTPVVFDKDVYPICLLEPGMKFPWGKECYVTGWGTTKFYGSSPDILREAKVKLVSHQVCNGKLSYGGSIHTALELCAGFEEGGIDSCQGDSGGPLSCDKSDRFYLTGVVSWGHGCAWPHKYGVYANMMELTKWVTETIEKIEN